MTDRERQKPTTPHLRAPQKGGYFVGEGRPTVLKSVGLGAIAGVVATAAMTTVMVRLHRRLKQRHRYPLPPREVTRAIANSYGTPGVTLAAHYAYGIAAGALFSTMVERPTLAGGATYGVAIWMASYLGWIPAVGLLAPATRHPPSRNALMIVSHAVWGTALAFTMRESSRAEAVVFGPGPPRDANR